MRLRAVVATNGSTPTEQMATAVQGLARFLPLDLLLVHVVSLDHLTYKITPDLQLEQIRQEVNRLGTDLLTREAAVFRKHGLGVEQKLLLGGDVATTLCSVTHRAGADLLILGRGFRRGDLHGNRVGATCERLLHNCRRALLVLRRGLPGFSSAEHPLRALVPLDRSEASARCVDYLEGISPAVKGMDLIVLYVINRRHPDIRQLPQNARYRAVTRLHDTGAELLRAAGERLRSHGYRVTLRQAEGSVGTTINRTCTEEDCALVFMGRSGFGPGRDPLLGAVSRHVAARCSAHVWLVG